MQYVVSKASGNSKITQLKGQKDVRGVFESTSAFASMLFFSLVLNILRRALGCA